MIHRGTPTLSSILQYILIAHCYSTEGQRVLNKVRATLLFIFVHWTNQIACGVVVAGFK